ncbi:hypothetical protein [Secundilactobacillus kimchicus]|uniref:hypothetical protein n=1 Tax=Secundilactobacillus kimchicus TaxID=528209 RepID=UPI000A682B14|nr:hypothetical protein [Secundilactobacillus kimchicus]
MKKISTKLLHGDVDSFSNNEHFMTTLKDMGFLKDSDEPVPRPIVESKSTGWIIARTTFLIIGIISALYVGYTTLIRGIPTGNLLIAEHIGLLENIIFIVLFSIVTTIAHELMHLLFGQLTPSKAGLHISAKTAVAKVSLSHVWVWSRLGRTAAVSAGVVLDLVELAVLSGLWLYSDAWFLPVACAILWVRILWQLRIHKRTDGQLVIAMISDNPSMLADLRNKRTAEITLINILGRMMSILIIVGWLLPLIMRIYRLIR